MFSVYCSHLVCFLSREEIEVQTVPFTISAQGGGGMLNKSVIIFFKQKMYFGPQGVSFFKPWGCRRKGFLSGPQFLPFPHQH